MKKRLDLRLPGIIFLIAALFAGGRMLIFLVRAERTVGVVTGLSGENSRCGRGTRDCTRFYATVRFQAGGSEHTTQVRAGAPSGHDRPVEYARYREGDSVAILFDPGNPEKALRDTFWDRWALPVLLSIAGTAGYISSWFERTEVNLKPDEIISLDLNKPS